MVVDDNATSRLILAETLRDSGMKPTVAASGEEAICAADCLPRFRPARASRLH